MMKCERCGKGIGVTRRGQALADGYICYKCLDELGFDKSKRSIKPWTLAYWEIKDGPNRINYNRAARKGKHEDWLQEHQDIAAFLNELTADDEEQENAEDTYIDEDE
ncbi:MAG: hypothetical protein IIZ78_08480 [Clostridiales bacterium]|nr:hypothetical protein [Clostridiales bacterium]